MVKDKKSVKSKLSLSERVLIDKFVLVFGAMIAVDRGVINLRDYISYRENSMLCKRRYISPAVKYHIWKNSPTKYRKFNDALFAFGLDVGLTKGYISLLDFDIYRDSLDVYMCDLREAKIELENSGSETSDTDVGEWFIQMQSRQEDLECEKCPEVIVVTDCTMIPDISPPISDEPFLS